MKFIFNIFKRTETLYSNYHVYRRLIKYESWLVWLLFFAGFLFGFLTTDFNRVYYSDPFYYILNAFEMKMGNFTPDPNMFPGWSMFLALVFKIFNITSFEAGMYIASLLSLFFFAATVFPLYGILKFFKSKLVLWLSLAAYITSTVLVPTAGKAMTEPFFIFLLMYSVLFLFKATVKKNNIYFSVLFAALSYYVRANGLFIFAAVFLLACLYFRKFGFRFRDFIFMILLFVVISAWHPVARYVAYGSPFYYDENSKYFAESYTQVWDKNVPVIGFKEYWQTHTTGQIFDKFITNGLFKMISDFSTYILTKLWFLSFIFAIFYFLVIRKTMLTNFLMVSAGIFMLGLVPVYHVFGIERHLFILVPFVILLSVLFFNEIIARHRKSFFVVFIGIILFLSPLKLVFSFITAPVSKYKIYNCTDRWPEWFVNHIEGNIVMPKYSNNVLRLFIENRKLAGIANPPINFITDGNFNSLDDAYAYYKRNNVKYIVLTNESFLLHDYFSSLLNDGFNSKFVFINKIRTIPGDEQSGFLFVYKVAG